jgi:hypothetical protein
MKFDKIVLQLLEENDFMPNEFSGRERAQVSLKTHPHRKSLEDAGFSFGYAQWLSGDNPLLVKHFRRLSNNEEGKIDHGTIFNEGPTNLIIYKKAKFQVPQEEDITKYLSN